MCQNDIFYATSATDALRLLEKQLPWLLCPLNLITYNYWFATQLLTKLCYPMIRVIGIWHHIKKHETMNGIKFIHYNFYYNKKFKYLNAL